MPVPSRLPARLLTLAALLALAGCGAIPEGRSAGPAARPQPARPALSTSPAFRQCLTDLGVQSVAYTPLPDRYLGGGCTQLGTVQLANAGTLEGEIALSNLGPVTCPLARSFAAWTQYGAARAARQMLGSELVRVETMGSYACRNVAGTARLSQHAHANAIDIGAFVLADGRRITVLDGWNGNAQERAFLRTVHASACKRFGTTLGPEYNAAHRDHFHVEMAGSGFCR